MRTVKLAAELNREFINCKISPSWDRGFSLKTCFKFNIVDIITEKVLADFDPVDTPEQVHSKLEEVMYALSIKLFDSNRLILFNVLLNNPSEPIGFSIVLEYDMEISYRQNAQDCYQILLHKYNNIISTWWGGERK